MRTSALQKYILLSCYNMTAAKVPRTIFSVYYGADAKAKKELREKIITQCLENLILRGWLVGYGVKTSGKWFIREVSLTKSGCKAARDLIGKQRPLPLKLK